MNLRRLPPMLADQRGVALPMALMTMLILAGLVVAFSVLSASEPTIGANQLRVAQSRALAEAGVERAIWALSHQAAPGGLADPLPAPAPAPYDGGTFVAVSTGGNQIGGFRVTVAAGAAANERSVNAVGWVPTDNAADARTKAHQRITATLAKLRFIDPPCALCVRGELEVSGSSSIDARPDTSCGNKAGTFTTGTTTIGGNAADVWGADGNNNRNQATDILQNQLPATFDQFVYTHADLDVLKSIAKSQGTYYRGAVTFNAGNKLPNGIIFVDTTDGQNITGATPAANFAAVQIHGNAPLGDAQNPDVFKGWIIVNGALGISGNYKMHGMAYSVNDLTYTGTGTGHIAGVVVSQNIRDGGTVVDSNIGGNAAITYNCNYARTGNGQIPQNWFVKAGTYKEVAD